MAEVALSATLKVTEPAIHAISAGVPDVSDATNGNSFVNTGVEVVVVDNTGAVSRTITFRDSAGNTIGSVMTQAANQMAVYGPFDPNIYGATVLFITSNVALECRVFDISRLKNLITRKTL